MLRRLLLLGDEGVVLWHLDGEWEWSIEETVESVVVHRHTLGQAIDELLLSLRHNRCLAELLRIVPSRLVRGEERKVSVDVRLVVFDQRVLG